jgi:CheY-like chemotaxis protein
MTTDQIMLRVGRRCRAGVPPGGVRGPVQPLAEKGPPGGGAGIGEGEISPAFVRQMAARFGERGDLRWAHQRVVHAGKERDEAWALTVADVAARGKHVGNKCRGFDATGIGVPRAFRIRIHWGLTGKDGEKVTGKSKKYTPEFREEASAQLLPDVVVMDLNMPGLNGVEATRRIIAANPSVAVLVLTMLDEDEPVFAAMRAGARGYVVKDADTDDLLRALESVARGDPPNSAWLRDRGRVGRRAYGSGRSVRQHANGGDRAHEVVRRSGLLGRFPDRCGRSI